MVAAPACPHPCGVLGPFDLKDEPLYQRKAHALAAARAQAKKSGAASPSSTPHAASSRVSAPAAALAESSAVACFAERPGTCTVHVTNRSGQAIVLHRIALARSPGGSTATGTSGTSGAGQEVVQLLPLPLRFSPGAAAAASSSAPAPASAAAAAVACVGRVLLRPGDAFSGRFAFTAPRAGADAGLGCEGCGQTAALHPSDAAALGDLTVFWSRAVDANAAASATAAASSSPAEAAVASNLSLEGWGLAPAALASLTSALSTLGSSEASAPAAPVAAAAAAAELVEGSLVAATVCPAPMVVGLEAPFSVHIRRPPSAVVGVPFAVSYTFTNRSDRFQTLSVAAVLPRPTDHTASGSTLALSGDGTMVTGGGGGQGSALAPSGLVGSAFDGHSAAAGGGSGSGGVAYSRLGRDGLWAPYPPGVALALNRALSASPRGGRLVLGHASAGSSAAALALAGSSSNEAGGGAGSGHAGAGPAAEAAAFAAGGFVDHGGVGGGGESGGGGGSSALGAAAAAALLASVGGGAAASAAAAGEAGRRAGTGPWGGAGALEVRWGAEAKGHAASNLPPGHPDTGLIEVCAATGSARAVRKEGLGTAQQLLPTQAQAQLGQPAAGWPFAVGVATASGVASLLPGALGSEAEAAASVARGGAVDGSDAFLWGGLKAGRVVVEPKGTVVLTYTLVAVRGGRLPLPQLDVALAGFLRSPSAEAGEEPIAAAAFVVRETAQPPTALFVAPFGAPVPVSMAQP